MYNLPLIRPLSVIRSQLSQISSIVKEFSRLDIESRRIM